MNTDEQSNAVLDDALAESGLRMTRQRRLVYDALIAESDHPTAEELFSRVKKRMPTISLATVYNCLEKLVECGLIRQVNRDRDSTRYCGNLKPHAHFYCNACGKVIDIDLTRPELRRLHAAAGDGFHVEQFDVNFRGLCPKCRSEQN